MNPGKGQCYSNIACLGICLYFFHWVLNLALLVKLLVFIMSRLYYKRAGL